MAGPKIAHAERLLSRPENVETYNSHSSSIVGAIGALVIT
jgi:hypothetical protein